MLDFAGRVAIVTGAGRGMGRTHALSLASRGARVVVNDISGDHAADVVREIEAAGGIAVADSNNVVGGSDAIVRAALAAFGRLDILVNNAGILGAKAFEDQSAAEWWGVFEIHVRGTVDLCRAAWPHLKASGAGRIVNISSSGSWGNGGLSAYGTAKAAIFGFTRSAAIEGGPVGINVNCILPSAWTAMTAEIDDPAIRKTLIAHFQPEHTSALVTWLAHQDTQATCQAIEVGGGRAALIQPGMAPSIKAPESTPEGWAACADDLLAGGELTPVLSTAAMFERELLLVDPELKHAMSAAGGGLALQDV